MKFIILNNPNESNHNYKYLAKIHYLIKHENACFKKIKNIFRKLLKENPNEITLEQCLSGIINFYTFAFSSKKDLIKFTNEFQNINENQKQIRLTIINLNNIEEINQMEKYKVKFTPNWGGVGDYEFFNLKNKTVYLGIHEFTGLMVKEDFYPLVPDTFSGADNDHGHTWRYTKDTVKVILQSGKEVPLPTFLNYLKSLGNDFINETYLLKAGLKKDLKNKANLSKPKSVTYSPR